jgi:hypothetical protein
MMSKWIKYDIHNKPKENISYLTFSKGMGYIVSTFIESKSLGMCGFYATETGKFEKLPVDYFMELPKPPEEK